MNREAVSSDIPAASILDLPPLKTVRVLDASEEAARRRKEARTERRATTPRRKPGEKTS